MEKEKTSEEQNSRFQILEAALNEFAEFGPAGARVDRIAENAGVNKAMIYYHFQSKKNLYKQVFAEHVFEKLSKVRRSLDENSDLETMLHAITGVYCEIFQEGNRFRKLLIRELADNNSEIIEKLAELLRQSEIPARLYKAIQDGSEHGDLRQVDALNAQISFIVMNIGTYIMYPLFHKVLGISDPSTFFENRRETIVDLFLNGVRKA